MSDAVQAAAPVAAVTAAKKVAKKTKEAKAPKAKIPSTHPAYAEMIKKAIVDNKERGGSSKSAVLKYIVTHFKVGENITKVR